MQQRCCRSPCQSNRSGLTILMPCCCMLLLLLIVGCPSICLILLILGPIVIHLWHWCRCMLFCSGHLRPQRDLQLVILASRLRLLCSVHRLLDERASPWDPTELLQEVLAEVLRQVEQVQWEGEELRPLLVPGSQAQMQIARHQDCTVDTLNTKLAHCNPCSHQRSSLPAICGICAINIPQASRHA